MALLPSAGPSSEHIRILSKLLLTFWRWQRKHEFPFFASQPLHSSSATSRSDSGPSFLISTILCTSRRHW